MKAMPMERELLKPEDATNWDDFLERITLERSARSDHRESFPAAIAPSAIVGRMSVYGPEA
jgi:hypothetical protein